MAEAVAERIVREEMESLGREEQELGRCRKEDVGKAAMANRLRRETTMTLKWTARRLEMGSASKVTQCLREAKR